jgi:hypothetical protein
MFIILAHLSTNIPLCPDYLLYLYYMILFLFLTPAPLEAHNGKGVRDLPECTHLQCEKDFRFCPDCGQVVHADELADAPRQCDGHAWNTRSGSAARVPRFKFCPRCGVENGKLPEGATIAQATGQS